MNCLEQTAVFANWLLKLKDPLGKARILARLSAAQAGNFGDCEAIGHGLWEMRIHCGPGYRVYFCRRAERVYLLLAAGNKSTQQRDIGLAIKLAKDICWRTST